MDKYEDIAQKILDNPTSRLTTWVREKWLPEFLADALREYDEQRAKGTCGTCRYHELHTSDMNGARCFKLSLFTRDDFGCIEYSPRIAEVPNANHID